NDTETCMLELNPDHAQISSALADHMKVAFGPSWKESLCEKEIDEKIDPGQPALLVISLSALRSLDLLRELRPLTSECRAAKLFSKHMKIEEQASALKNRVNIASGTPSRIKKLIDVEALGLSRLAVIVLDMKTDTKGYSLLTLPQVRDEFWDLYRNYFHQRVLEGALRICLYDEIPVNIKKEKSNQDE
ncbi:protein CMSS1-like, partial [Solanum tuberosum]|uniref:protein CMSS1-like n=1 Tax=Solanum tuberosum TaxID=4113 RepID=UPI00073A17B0